MTPVAYAEPRAISAGIARGNRKLNVEGRMNIDDLRPGDKLELLNQEGWMDLKAGEVYTIEAIANGEVYLHNGPRVLGMHLKDFKIVEVEDRFTWHPHHDVIVAWAKGAEIQHEWGGEWLDAKTPQWKIEKRYRVKPEPDHTSEIAEIEQEMRKLADRLEKLK